MRQDFFTGQRYMDLKKIFSTSNAQPGLKLAHV
jgi:hypothetical protein